MLVMGEGFSCGWRACDRFFPCQTVRSDPTYAAAYNNLGVVLRDEGKVKEAIAYYDQCIALCNEGPEVCSCLTLFLCVWRRAAERSMCWTVVRTFARPGGTSSAAGRGESPSTMTLDACRTRHGAEWIWNIGFWWQPLGAQKPMQGAHPAKGAAQSGGKKKRIYVQIVRL